MIENSRGVSLTSHTVTLATCSQTINANDLPGVGIHHWDDWQWVCIEVGIRVLVVEILCEA